ncbi:MAG: DegT/DnrJ/EryC1/StrS family aminotransferase, partial [Spirochaetaceae bacterium]|nr:DegT/DnrJ/EryC1/StrS family aminotransferase [Spirochaetaceae bacterium]
STKYCELDESKFPKGKRFWFQDFDDCGYNFRMTDIQAAVGSTQLKKLDEMNCQRIISAEYLLNRLKGIPGLILPVVKKDRNHIFHLFPVRIMEKELGIDKIDFIFRMYNEKGIKVGAHYGVLHLTTAFRNRGFKVGDFPVAEQLMQEVITLPVKPGQSEEVLDYMVNSIKSLIN